jgi:hypothetical protein
MRQARPDHPPARRQRRAARQRHSLCLAPPLMTPEATLDRIVQIVGESIAAAA